MWAEDMKLLGLRQRNLLVNVNSSSQSVSIFLHQFLTMSWRGQMTPIPHLARVASWDKSDCITLVLKTYYKSPSSLARHWWGPQCSPCSPFQPQGEAAYQIGHLFYSPSYLTYVTWVSSFVTIRRWNLPPWIVVKTNSASRMVSVACSGCLCPLCLTLDVLATWFSVNSALLSPQVVPWLLPQCYLPLSGFRLVRHIPSSLPLNTLCMSQSLSWYLLMSQLLLLDYERCEDGAVLFLSVLLTQSKCRENVDEDTKE